MSLLTDVMALCNIPNLTTKSHDLAVHMAMDALLYGPDIDALSTGLIQGPIVPQHCHFFGLRNLNAPTTLKKYSFFLKSSALILGLPGPGEKSHKIFAKEPFKYFNVFLAAIEPCSLQALCALHIS